MRRLAWATDIHLNFCKPPQIWGFAATLRDGDAVLLGGDIAEAPSVEEHLKNLERLLQRPIYFVLGNHDFYGGRIADVRARVKALAEKSRWLKWLPATGVVELTEETALVGCDGWGDGRLGSGIQSPVILNDFSRILDLAGLFPKERFEKLASLGDEAAESLHRLLPAAFERRRRVILLTHVPPFRESCWYEGKISEDDWLPYFTCKAAGDAILEVMKTRPECDLTVLCGHTHGEGLAEILPNLRVRTGAAKYGAPQMQAPVEIS